MIQEETDILKRAIDTHISQLRRNASNLTGSWNLPALKDCYLRELVVKSHDTNSHKWMEVTPDGKMTCPFLLTGNRNDSLELRQLPLRQTVRDNIQNQRIIGA